MTLTSVDCNSGRKRSKMPSCRQLSPKIVNDGVFEGFFRAAGWCSIAAIDVQFPFSWEMMSKDLQINRLSKLVHLGLGWSAPRI